MNRMKKGSHEEMWQRFSDNDQGKEGKLEWGGPLNEAAKLRPRRVPNGTLGGSSRTR